MITEQIYPYMKIIDGKERSFQGNVVFPSFLSEQETEVVRRFHEGICGYERTPLKSLKDAAKRAGVEAIFVKDESFRFGLNAFKGLGGTYALFRVICRELNLDPMHTTLEMLQKEPYHSRIEDMVFITTTDGNHGKGVSWAAGLLGCKSYVYMPKNSVEVRAQAIRDAGTAEVTITELGYDDCVRYTAELATKNGWYLIQDTSWEGYVDIPTWIVQGYTTMFYEACAQMKEAGYDAPTHIFLQAGVGAMAGGIAGAAVCTFQEKKPVISVVEPVEVACVYESVKADDGKSHKATGSEITIMAGLNCGECCTITWPVLRDFGDFYFAVADEVAARGMRFFAVPEGEDPVIVSGESGAATGGVLSLLLEKDAYASVRESLGIDESSVIFLISTEGDTDPEGYESIVKGDKFPF